MTLKEHLASAARKLRGRKTNSNLSWYLTWKSRLGRWDDRYCGYYRVPVPSNKWVRRAITRGYAKGLVPTSTTNGTHAPGSFHYTGRAVDMGVRSGEVGTATQRKRLESFQRSEFSRWSSGVSRATEIIGPINYLVVLKGRQAPLPEGTALENAHDNHVHVAKA